MDEDDPYSPPQPSDAECESALSQPASLRRRFIAGFIDLLITAFISAALGAIPLYLSYPIYIEGSYSFFYPEWIPVIPLVGFVAPLLYHAISVSRARATLGKRICLMQVITPDGNNLSFLNGLIRFPCSCISLVFFGVGYVIAVGDPDRRTFHDRLVGSVVLDRVH